MGCPHGDEPERCPACLRYQAGRRMTNLDRQLTKAAKRVKELETQLRQAKAELATCLETPSGHLYHAEVQKRIDAEAERQTAWEDLKRAEDGQARLEAERDTLGEHAQDKHRQLQQVGVMLTAVEEAILMYGSSLPQGFQREIETILHPKEPADAD